MLPPEPEHPLPDGDGVLLPPDAFLGILTEVLARGRPVRFRAGGLSMFPLIHDGDVLTVSPLSPDEPKLGDIVAARRPADGRILVHRVIGRRRAGILTRGDAAVCADGVVSCSAIIGSVTRVERDGRAVRLGSAPERRVLAMLSRKGWLIPVLLRLRSGQGAMRRLHESRP